MRYNELIETEVTPDNIIQMAAAIRLHIDKAADIQKKINISRYFIS